MATYAQLQAESWWGREIVTPEIDWLGDTLCARTGRPRAAFGCKGDNNHLRGSHRSQEWIQRSRFATSRTYTVQSGLTQVQQRHNAGVDFTPGSAAEMVAQCKRIYNAMRADQLDEVREFYGNVNGDKVVDGWDNVRDRAASSDSSHLWHWHLSLDRRHCANRHLMERIAAIVLGDTLEVDMDQKEKLVEQTGNASATVGDVLADLSNLRNALVSKPGAKLGSNPLVPAGSVLDLLTQAAKTPPGTVVVSDEQLERVLRRVIGSVDGASPTG